jgi:hypothetical protein
VAKNSFEIGSWVRVRDNCPLTLPYYARTAIGQVVELEHGALVVTFLGGRSFPVPGEWLETTNPPSN